MEFDLDLAIKWLSAARKNCVDPNRIMLRVPDTALLNEIVKLVKEFATADEYVEVLRWISGPLPSGDYDLNGLVIPDREPEPSFNTSDAPQFMEDALGHLKRGNS